MKKGNYGAIRLLSFLFPEVAIFLYYMQDDKKDAKSEALLYGLKFWIAMVIILLILYLVVIFLPMLLNAFN